MFINGGAGSLRNDARSIPRRAARFTLWLAATGAGEGRERGEERRWGRPSTLLPVHALSHVVKLTIETTKEVRCPCRALPRRWRREPLLARIRP